MSDNQISYSMDAIELYKRLPGTNCGECGVKTCMAFAVSVLQGASDLSACPYLSEEETGRLQSSLQRSDWREKLIRDLRKEVASINLQDIAEDIGAELRDETLVLNCLGREFLVSPGGNIHSKGHMTPWVQILLLHYIRIHGKAVITESWTSYGELKGGMVKASSFTRDCEEPLRALLDSNIEGVSSILQRLGAVHRESFPSPFAWHLFLLPRIPVIILYWPRDDEFDSKVKILFDSTADTFLDAEAIIFLLEGLAKNIEMQMQAGS
jgi:hypothetical protein